MGSKVCNLFFYHYYTKRFLVLLGRTLAIYNGVVGRKECTCLCKVFAIIARLKNK